MKKVMFILSFILLSGCAGLTPADKNVQRKFTYDYTVKNTGKDELWTRARDFFAKSYGNINSVMRVQDKESSTFIGRGAATWYLASNRCATEYSIQFKSKDNKARLQLEIIEGVPAFSTCTGWPWPNKDGYQTILVEFETVSRNLGQALKKQSTLSDF